MAAQSVDPGLLLFNHSLVPTAQVVTNLNKKESGDTTVFSFLPVHMGIFFLQKSLF